MSFLGYLVIYLTGGITFLPLVGIGLFIYIKGGIQPLLALANGQQPEEVHYKDPDTVIVKKGWIRLINQYQPKMPEVSVNNANGGGIISGIQSYVGNKEASLPQKKGLVYGILKHGTLFCYESEKQQDIIMILPMQDFQVSLYPPFDKNSNEGTIYGRTTVVRLVPNTLFPLKKEEEKKNMSQSVCTLDEEDITANPHRIMYLTCARNTDKEDWYFGLLDAQFILEDTKKDKVQYVMMDNTHFDYSAMKELIHQVQSSPSHRETAWINAVFGRLFLGMYKTDRLKQFVENKIRKKIDKTKRPTFLDEITVRKVDVGGSVPFITEPKLLSLSPEGEVIVEAKVEYHGGLTIEIETDFNWSYSSLMKPIRMHLVLSVNLKKLAGRMMFKIKAPPTNRYWLAFFEMPEMEWKITPIVADKQIKLNIVTNAIESRIREVMAETFVLPNMDDTSFCPSEGKGGIFGERVKVKVEKKSKGKGYKNNNQQENNKTQSSNASLNVRHTPTVPDQAEITSAADTLKLDARRAESATDLIGNTSSSHNLAPSQKLEASHSTPAMQFTTPAPSIPVSSGGGGGGGGDDHHEFIQPIDQKSIAESTGSNSSSKWSSTSSYLRKRVSKTDEDHSDSESIKSTKSNNTGSGFFNKISHFLPTESMASTSDTSSSIKSSPSTTTASSTNGSNKKQNSLMHRAENYLLTKKGYPGRELLNEEKKELYVERLRNMRKRAAEKTASLSSGISNSISPPPLPPLPSVNKPMTTTTLPSAPEESDLNPPSRRERAASVVHTNSSSHHLQPPIPPRRNSTPDTPTDDLIHSNTTTTDEPTATALVAPVLTEEPIKETNLSTTTEIKSPPLPTTPRPNHTSNNKPDLPPRNAHLSPPLPPRHT